MTSRTRGFMDWGWASICAPRSSNGMEGGCGSKVGKALARPSFLPSHTHQRATMAREGSGKGVNDLASPGFLEKRASQHTRGECPASDRQSQSRGCARGNVGASMRDCSSPDSFLRTEVRSCTGSSGSRVLPLVYSHPANALRLEQPLVPFLSVCV